MAQRKRGRPSKYPNGSVVVSFTCCAQTYDEMCRRASIEHKSISELVQDFITEACRDICRKSLYEHQLNSVRELVTELEVLLGKRPVMYRDGEEEYMILEKPIRVGGSGEVH